MSLSKWVSNTPCISNLSDNNNKPAKVLGLHWQPGEDTLSYNACRLTQADSTKRQALSLVQRIFDPLKQQSLPRLELCGALLLCRLIVAVKDALRHKEVKPRTPGGDVENEDAVFGGRRALARTPPPSAPPVTSGIGVFQFGANGKEAQPPQQPICDPLDLLRTLGTRASDLVKRMNDQRHVDNTMRELGLRIVALHALVLKNVDKLQSSTTCSSSTGTQTTPKPSNNGAKRQRESPHLPTRKSSPKRQRGSNQKQSSKQLDRPASFRDETTPSGTVSHDKTPTAKKQLQWQQVGPKAKKKKIPREPRPDAIIIQPQGDLSYSDILKLVTRRQDDKLKEVSVNVNRIRKTVKGELLLELNGASKDNTSKLKEEISEVLGLQSGIRTVTQETCLEIRDLDSLASKEDIAAAISAEIRTVVDVCSIKSLRPAYAGTQLAVVCLPPAQAKALLQEGKVKVGWTRCRVRERSSQRRCYRCLEFGHLAARCTSVVDRSGQCLRCGANGHKALNLNHCAAAKDLLCQTVRECSIDVAVLSEPYRTPESTVCALDVTKKTALWSCGDPPVQLLDIRSETGFVRANVGGIWVYSVYLAPSLSLTEFSSILDLLVADARAILYFIGQQTATDQPAVPGWKRFRVDSLNTERFSDLLSGLNTEGSAEHMANDVMDQLDSICNATMTQRKHYGRHHRPVYWWNDNIADLRRECNHARRRYQRSRGRASFLQWQVIFRERRRVLKAAIRESKRQCFLELCDSADRDPWGRAYKIVVKKLGSSRQAPPSDPVQIKAIVEELFPRMEDLNYGSFLDSPEPQSDGSITEVTHEEIVAATRSTIAGRAPGPDSIPNSVLKLALTLRPEIFADLFTKCLSEGDQVSGAATWSCGQKSVQMLEKRCEKGVDTLDKPAFEQMMQGAETTGNATNRVDQLMTHLLRACDASMRKTSGASRQKAVYWWNSEIAEARRSSLRARRAYQRALRRDDTRQEAFQEDFRRKRRTLKILIKASKRQHFLDLCDQADADPWGMAYKLTMKRLHAFRPPSPSCPQLMGRIVEQLFPTQEPMATSFGERSRGSIEASFNLVTQEEIYGAARRIKSGKAPGPDGLPSSVIKLAMELQPNLFAEVFNTCLKEGKI
ncbi:hypothetical protein ACLKA6_005733 [Drosophila palustris]